MIARPSLPLFVAAGCGALVGLLAGLAWWPLAGLALLAGGAACVATTRVARAALLLATAATLAAAAGSLEAKRALQRRAQLPDGIVILDGVVDDVIATPYGWRSLVDVDGVLDPAPRPLTLRVSVMSDALRARPGDHVRVRGVLRAPEPADAPGQLDGRRYALALGIDASLSAYAPTDIAVLARERAWRPFALLRLALRDRLTSLLTPREAGLVLALVVGDTSLIDPEQRELYRAVGAGHLLAVSGLQVSLIALLLRRALMSLLLLTPPGRRVRGRALASIIALACVWSFVMVCGAPASAVRAGAMASALLAAEILGRRASALDSLGIAGLFTILLSPQSVLDASFLLSYAAVIGLAAAMRPRANDFDDDAAASASPPILTKLRDGAITCLGAGLVTLPVSAWLFGQVSLSGIFANIVVVPAAALLQIPSIALGLLGALCDSAFIARLGAQTALLLEALVAGFADLLPGTRTVDVPSGVAVLLLTACAVVVSAAVARARASIAIGAALAALVILLAGRMEPGGVRITVLPVGQGDGAVFELPDGQVMLLDAGGNVLSSRDPGAEVVLPFLARRGIDHVDVLVMSHPHPDHAKGLAVVANSLPIKEIWHPGVPADDAYFSPIIKAAPAARLRSTPELLGVHQFGPVRVEVLAPAPAERTSTYPELGANDNSLVLRICSGDVCALWPGDIEELGEELLLESKATVTAALVKAPHHGSGTSSTDAFVARTGARHVVLCTGRNNTFGFPNPKVVERWRAAGARVWDTAENGEITAWLSPQGIRVRAFRE